MKKMMALVSALVCVLVLAGCKNAKQVQGSTYTFRGEHEYFVISNGSIVFSDTEEVFRGGYLEITQSDFFEDVASYSTTFYTITNGKRKIILSDRVIDQTGSSVDVNGELGSVSGEDVIFGNKISNIDELKENLWFELKITDLNGEDNVYQIKLIVTE